MRLDIRFNPEGPTTIPPIMYPNVDGRCNMAAVKPAVVPIRRAPPNLPKDVTTSYCRGHGKDDNVLQQIDIEVQDCRVGRLLQLGNLRRLGGR